MAGVSWTEKTVAGAGYTPGTPSVGGSVRILFGAIVFNQGRFLSTTTDYTERTAATTSYTEKTVTESTYTEKEI